MRKSVLMVVQSFFTWHATKQDLPFERIECAFRLGSFVFEHLATRSGLAESQRASTAITTPCDIDPALKWWLGWGDRRFSAWGDTQGGESTQLQTDKQACFRTAGKVEMRKTWAPCLVKDLSLPVRPGENVAYVS